MCVSFQVCAEVAIQNTGGARAPTPLLVPRATNQLAVSPRKAANARLVICHERRERHHLPERASHPTPVCCQRPRMRGPSGWITPLLSPALSRLVKRRHFVPSRFRNSVSSRRITPLAQPRLGRSGKMFVCVGQCVAVLLRRPYAAIVYHRPSRSPISSHLFLGPRIVCWPLRQSIGSDNRLTSLGRPFSTGKAAFARGRRQRSNAISVLYPGMTILDPTDFFFAQVTT